MMKISLVVLAAVMMIASLDASILERIRRGTDGADCACPFIEWPMCGKDGQTYPNMCVMECAGVEMDYEGDCSTRRKRSIPSGSISERIRRGTDGSDCACELIEWPMCGKDGQTYANMCVMECAGVEMDYEGDCSTRRKRSIPSGAILERTRRGTDGADCACELIEWPMCGKDGQTYANMCVMECAGVDMDYEGDCSTRRKRSIPTGSILERTRRGTDGSDCACELIEWPMCGKDGQTYANMCVMECAGVEMDYEGNCSERRKRSFFEYEDCNCPKIFLPVCGTDDVTYPSQCVRQCAGVDFKNFGECKDE